MSQVIIPGQPDQPGQIINLPDPVQTPTPGAGVSFDPTVTNLLASNNAVWLEAWAQNQAIGVYLMAVSNWKENAQQQVANGLPVPPSPQPPAGYTPPAPPPVVIPPVAGNQTVVHAIDQWGQYPAPGDNNPAGTRIANPYISGETLVKVIQATPFGDSEWWVSA